VAGSVVELKSASAVYSPRELMAADWLARLGRRGFEELIDSVVEQSLARVVRDRVEPRLASVENRLAAIETRLNVSDRLSKLELEVASLKKER